MTTRYVYETKWQEFLKADWEHYMPSHHDDLCHAVDSLIHSERSLRTIAARHSDLLLDFKALEPTCSAYLLRAHPRYLSPEERHAISRHSEVIALIHLDIETFYLFAKILLDRIATGIEVWFGAARSMSVSSHSKLTRNCERYARCIGIELPSGPR